MKSLLVTLYFNTENSRPVGKLFLSDLTGKYHFEFDTAFAATGFEISPITLPLSGKSFDAPRNEDFYDLHGVFADSLPDDWGKKVQDLEFEKAAIPDPTAIDRLAFVGRYGIGALRYEPSKDFKEGGAIVSLADLRKATQRIIEGHCEEVTDDLMRSGGSAGGMRPKFLVDLDLINLDKIRYTTGRPEGNYYPVVIKTPSRDGDHFQRIEFAFSQMARACGIDIPETFLLPGEKSKQAFFAIKRFDVLENGDRLHVHTYAGLHGLNFRDASSDYSELLRTCHDLSRDHSQVVEAYRRMVFNFIGYNNDDHTKNFSFVMDKKGMWKLSQAYDMSFSKGRQGLHIMSLNGIRRNATVRDFEKMAVNFNVKNWKDIVEKTCDCLNDWDAFSAKAKVPESYRALVRDRIKENVSRVKF